MSDDYLRRVTIGERKPHNSTVELAPYDAAWPTRFDDYARQILGALSGQVRLLEHVGSTSVPGLAAKPVIDLALAVDDSTDEDAYVPPLEAEGFRLRIREPDWFEHRLLKARSPTANLHVFTAGCAEIDRMRAFRDHLRSDAADRRKYEAVKRQLAGRVWADIQDYADAKSEVISEILARAARR